MCCDFYARFKHIFKYNNFQIKKTFYCPWFYLLDFWGCTGWCWRDDVIWWCHDDFIFQVVSFGKHSFPETVLSREGTVLQPHSCSGSRLSLQPYLRFEIFRSMWHWWWWWCVFVAGSALSSLMLNKSTARVSRRSAHAAKRWCDDNTWFYLQHTAACGHASIEHDRNSRDRSVQGELQKTKLLRWVSYLKHHGSSTGSTRAWW